jgi:hypothetical protein
MNRIVIRWFFTAFTTCALVVGPASLAGATDETPPAPVPVGTTDPAPEPVPDPAPAPDPAPPLPAAPPAPTPAPATQLPPLASTPTPVVAGAPTASAPYTSEASHQVLQPWVPWTPAQSAAYAQASALAFQRAEAATNVYLQQFLQQGMPFDAAWNASIEAFNSNPADTRWSLPGGASSAGLPGVPTIYGLSPTGELILPIHSTGAAVHRPLTTGTNRVTVANTGSGLSEVEFRFPGTHGEVIGTRLVAPGRVWSRSVTAVDGAEHAGDASVTPVKPVYLDLLQGRGSGLTADPSFDFVVAPNG